MSRNRPKCGTTVVTMLALALAVSSPALGHCDGMDGPVVKAAQKALETGDVNLVLIWVRAQDEPEIRSALEKTLAVRKLSEEARHLADTWFFETLVRVHRAGEGAPYTGLKPAGRDLGPAIPAADKALKTGSVDDVLKLLTDATHNGVRDRFAELMAKKSFETDDVAAGREYVHAYVIFVHYVEGLHQATSGSAHGHASGEEKEHAMHGCEQAKQLPHHHDAGDDSSAKVQIPQPLKKEHDELHAELVKATKVTGKIGEAARAVAKVLHPHFVKEEQFALPPLGVLPALAHGQVTSDMPDILAMSDRLKAELPEMLVEHQSIVAALQMLSEAAQQEHNREIAHFAEKLILHAQTEEQVLYPAAMLAGEFIKMKMSE